MTADSDAKSVQTTTDKPPWQFECVARNPDTLRNCPYSLYCAVCDEDDADA